MLDRMKLLSPGKMLSKMAFQQNPAPTQRTKARFLVSRVFHSQRISFEAIKSHLAQCFRSVKIRAKCTNPAAITGFTIFTLQLPIHFGSTKVSGFDLEHISLGWLLVNSEASVLLQNFLRG